MPSYWGVTPSPKTVFPHKPQPTRAPTPCPRSTSRAD
jgi:hypothetical protein